MRHKRWKRRIAIIGSMLLALALLFAGLKYRSNLPINRYQPVCTEGYEERQFRGKLAEPFKFLLVYFFRRDGFAIDISGGDLFVSIVGIDRSLRDIYLNGEDKIARSVGTGIIINDIHYPTPPLARKLIKERWEGRQYQKKLAETLVREGEYTIWPTDVDYFIRDCAIKRALVMEPAEPVPPNDLPDLRFLAPVRPIPEETLSITVPPPENAAPQPFWVRWLQAW